VSIALGGRFGTPNRVLRRSNARRCREHTKPKAIAINLVLHRSLSRSAGRNPRVGRIGSSLGCRAAASEMLN
jgi:hypothetical protein